MDKSNIYEKFLKFEEDYNLFDIKLEGIPIWESLRYKIYRRIKIEKNVIKGLDKTSEKQHHSKIRNLKSLLKNNLKCNRYPTKNIDFLFYGHPRRKFMEDGYWWDIYCDPIYENTDLNFLHIEDPYNDTHLRPPRTENICYTDSIYYRSHLLRKMGLIRVNINSAERSNLDDATNGIKDIFGVKTDIFKAAKFQLQMRKSMIKHYDSILSDVDPDIAVIVISYGREIFIEACKKRGIPVVELQHGIINEKHMGYHFPGTREKKYFPDYLFTFGKFWNTAADLPIPKKNVISVGYPYLEKESKKYYSLSKKKQIVFLSQWTIGDRLSKIAVELAKKHLGLKIIYKLHPREKRWKTAYPWLNNSGIKVVADEIPLYKLFAESSIQVGVNSTAIFEGLYFDLDTYLVNMPGVEGMSFLIDNKYATIVDSADDLYKKLQESRVKEVHTSYFFESNSITNIVEELDRIRENHA